MVRRPKVSALLLPGEAEHRKDDYRRRNLQMLVRFFEDGDAQQMKRFVIPERTDRQGNAAREPLIISGRIYFVPFNFSRKPHEIIRHCATYFIFTLWTF